MRPQTKITLLRTIPKRDKECRKLSFVYALQLVIGFLICVGSAFPYLRRPMLRKFARIPSRRRALYAGGLFLVSVVPLFVITALTLPGSQSTGNGLPWATFGALLAGGVFLVHCQVIALGLITVNAIEARVTELRANSSSSMNPPSDSDVSS